MSRLDDITDLIQTTNEVYFITAPGRVRTAYILVDDIIELALKTYLQEQTLQRRVASLAALESAGWATSPSHKSAFERYCRSEIDATELCQKLGRAKSDVRNLETIYLQPFDPLQHWSANDPNARKQFDEIVDEVKDLQKASPRVLTLLDHALERHGQRNKFFHDHHQSGLTVDDDKCLRALCDLFALMEAIFSDFLSHVQANKTVRCQVGVLRLKLSSSGSSDIKDTYNLALEEFSTNHTLNRRSDNFEHSILHTISERFFMVLRKQFEDTIAELEVRADKIDNMQRPRKKHNRERVDITQRLDMLQQQLSAIKLLLGAP